LKNRSIGGLDSDVQEPSNLADQRSKSDQHITIGGGYRRLPHKYCGSDRCGQRGPSIKRIDRRLRLTRDIVSEKHMGVLTNSLGLMRYAIAISRIAILRQSSTMERGYIYIYAM